MKTILALTLALITSPAFARIGETPAECITRYGEPLKVIKDKSQLLFQKSGLIVMAQFHEGKCEMLGIRKIEQDVLGNAVALSENEIEMLLNANAGGSVWIKQEGFSLDSQWQTENGELLAQYENLHNFMVIMSRACADRTEQDKKAEEQKKLDGF